MIDNSSVYMKKYEIDEITINLVLSLCILSTAKVITHRVQDALQLKFDLVVAISLEG